MRLVRHGRESSRARDRILGLIDYEICGHAAEGYQAVKISPTIKISDAVGQI
jgi:hypothetical protein